MLRIDVHGSNDRYIRFTSRIENIVKLMDFFIGIPLAEIKMKVKMGNIVETTILKPFRGEPLLVSLSFELYLVDQE